MSLFSRRLRLATAVCLLSGCSIVGCASSGGGAADSVPDAGSNAAAPSGPSLSEIPQDSEGPEGRDAGSEEPSEAEYSNTLRWATASEVDNFGFDVYRAEAEGGEYVRLTETPIVGAGTSDLPSEYEYIDVTIDPRRPYFYYVESISMAGVRERFTPIIRAKAKIDPEDESDSPF